jgi:hypothetical protein
VVPLEGKPKHKKKKKSTMTPTAEEAPVSVVTGGLKRVAPTPVPEDAGLPPPAKKARTMPLPPSPSLPARRGVRPVLCWLSRRVPLARSHVIPVGAPSSSSSESSAPMPIALHWSAAMQATWLEVRELYQKGASTIAYVHSTHRGGSATDIQTRLIANLRRGMDEYWTNPSPDKKAGAFLNQAIKATFSSFADGNDGGGEVRRVSLAFMVAVAWLALFLVDEEGAALLPDIPASLLQSDEIPPSPAQTTTVSPAPVAVARGAEEDDDDDVFSMASRDPLPPPPPPPPIFPALPLARPVGIYCPFDGIAGQDEQDGEDANDGHLRLAVLMQMMPFHRDTLRAFLSDFKARHAALLFGTDWRVPRVLLRHSTSTATPVPIMGQPSEHTTAVIRLLYKDFFSGFCAAIGTKPADAPSSVEFILALVAAFHVCKSGPMESPPAVPRTTWE